MRDDRYGAGKLWHDYLVYRVVGETDRSVGRFVEIREAAEALWSRITRSSGTPGEDGEDGESPRPRTLRDIVDGLCWLALERGTKSPGDKQNWANHPQGLRHSNPTNAAVNLLCAAAYFNEVSVAAPLLEKGESTPVYEMDLFPQAIEIAALRGHREMLDLFQTHLWDVAEAADINVRMPDDLDEEWIMWSVNQWPGAIRGALLADDLSVLQHVIFPPTLSDYPPPLLTKRFAFPGVAGPAWICASSLCMLQRFAKSPAMWDYMTQLGANANSHLDQMETWYAQHGNLTMLRHCRIRFAEAGMPPRPGTAPPEDPVYQFVPPWGNPLRQASQNSYEDVVDYLLEEYGATGEDPPRSDLSLVAARAGSLRIMAKLIDAAVLSKASRGRLLTAAVLAENRAMVELLVRNGFVFTETDRVYAAEKASMLGLNSMVDHLKSGEMTVSSETG